MFCTQPANHMDVLVENQHVFIQPCNVWKGKMYAIDEYKKVKAELVTTLKDGYHYPGCRVCFDEDKKNIRSRREAQNEFCTDNKLALDKIQSLGVRYGTLCNSKCMVCSVDRSSSWLSDSVKLGYEVLDKYRFKKNLLPGMDIFFENFDLGDLRYVEFHGGEPLMQSYPLEFLQRVDKLENLVVKFNTNLTILPSPELTKLLDKCKRVDMLISVDDVDRRYEILRYPGKWEVLEKNIQKVKEQGYRLSAFNVLSSLNIFYALEFYKWATRKFGREVHSQFAIDRDILDISYLNQTAKDKVLDKIKNINGRIFDSIRQKLYLDSGDSTEEMKKYILDLDKIRNTNYPGTFKEWWTILNTK